VTIDEARQAVVRAVHRVAPEAHVDDVGPRQSLLEGLDLDSLDFLAIIENVAASTGVSVPESDYALVDSLAGFVDYLVARGA
jgi:acyl carrier protein